MNVDTLKRLAIEIGMSHPSESLPFWESNFDELILFAKRVVEREREECAQLAQETVCDTHLPTGIKIYGTRVAKAIRARCL